ncbi:MAG: hypothetical protein CMF80_07770 [Candidatus Marinimicrobia bacterium]|nr:hypothetical protein [Candidatus Neomarinimicrobiota bacterium]|tara:strand:+ start:278 stop:1165 length:888 start_codon:yes stop_codon:yes gene_type:complete
MKNHNDGKLYCIECDYKTKNKNDFNKHLLTKKHLRNIHKKKDYQYKCPNCKKLYKHKNSVYKHEKLCKKINYDSSDKKQESIPIDKVEELIRQHHKNITSLVSSFEDTVTSNNKVINNLVSKVGNTTNNYNTMTINLFLKNECPNAMNLTDFMDSLKLNLEDLDYTRDNGYIKGITNIFVKNLNQLEPKERPIHYSDKKNQQFYIKDEDVWVEDNTNQKIDESIDTVSKKQILKIKEWEKQNPDWANTEIGANSFMNMVKQVTGGGGDKKDAFESIKKDLGNSLDIGLLIENDKK